MIELGRGLEEDCSILRANFFCFSVSDKTLIKLSFEKTLQRSLSSSYIRGLYSKTYINTITFNNNGIRVDAINLEEGNYKVGQHLLQV